MPDNFSWWQGWNNSFIGDRYGEVYGGHSVQEAVYNTLQTWMPAYIAEVNRQVGAEVLKNIVEYRHRPDFRTLPKNIECAILVLVPETSGTPQTFQDSIRANWKITINAFVYGSKDWQETQALTSAYAAAIRACILQHRDLGNFAETTKWMSESYLEGEHSGTRTSGMAKIELVTTVGSAVTPFGGPPLPQFTPTGESSNPSVLPLPAAPISTEVNPTISKEPL